MNIKIQIILTLLFSCAYMSIIECEKKIKHDKPIVAFSSFKTGPLIRFENKKQFCFAKEQTNVFIPAFCYSQACSKEDLEACGRDSPNKMTSLVLGNRTCHLSAFERCLFSRVTNKTDQPTINNFEGKTGHSCCYLQCMVKEGGRKFSPGYGSDGHFYTSDKSLCKAFCENRQLTFNSCNKEKEGKVLCSDPVCINKIRDFKPICLSNGLRYNSQEELCLARSTDSSLEIKNCSSSSVDYSTTKFTPSCYNNCLEEEFSVGCFSSRFVQSKEEFCKLNCQLKKEGKELEETLCKGTSCLNRDSCLQQSCRNLSFDFTNQGLFVLGSEDRKFPLTLNTFCNRISTNLLITNQPSNNLKFNPADGCIFCYAECEITDQESFTPFCADLFFHYYNKLEDFCYDKCIKQLLMRPLILQDKEISKTECCKAGCTAKPDKEQLVCDSNFQLTTKLSSCESQCGHIHSSIHVCEGDCTQADCNSFACLHDYSQQRYSYPLCIESGETIQQFNTPSHFCQQNKRTNFTSCSRTNGKPENHTDIDLHHTSNCGTLIDSRQYIGCDKEMNAVDGYEHCLRGCGVVNFEPLMCGERMCDYDACTNIQTCHAMKKFKGCSEGKLVTPKEFCHQSGKGKKMEIKWCGRRDCDKKDCVFYQDTELGEWNL